MFLSLSDTDTNAYGADGYDAETTAAKAKIRITVSASAIILFVMFFTFFLLYISKFFTV